MYYKDPRFHLDQRNCNLFDRDVHLVLLHGHQPIV
eukprot:XP_001706610.1 Hypothetical protein GL50803_36095 [Giardia lamblia ATCC 50803]